MLQKQNSAKSSLADRLAFDDPIWDKPDLEEDLEPSFESFNKCIYARIHKFGVIYKLTCTANNREYVGQTITYDYPNVACQLKRVIEHFHQLRKGLHDKICIQKDWTKHGEQSFRPAILEIYDERMFANRDVFKDFLN